MPELIVHKRRAFPRIPVKCSPSQITEIEDARRRKNQTAAFFVVGVLFIFCSVNGYWIVKEIQHDREVQKAEEQRTVARKRSSFGKRGVRNRFGSGSFFSSRVSGGKDGLSSEYVRKLEQSVAPLALLLPKLQKNKTDKANFKERYELFKKFYTSLSKREQKSVFPLITLEKFEKFYAEEPSKAAELLDKLIKRVRYFI